MITVNDMRQRRGRPGMNPGPTLTGDPDVGTGFMPVRAGHPKRSSSVVLLAAAALAAVACQKAPPTSTAEVVVVERASLPSDPNDAAWQDVPVHPAALLPQDLMEPRLLKPTTAEVRVRAITDGTRIALRLDWTDPTKNDLPGPARFSDACAVQFPAKVTAEMPGPFMGEKGKPVEISGRFANYAGLYEQVMMLDECEVRPLPQS